MHMKITDPATTPYADKGYSSWASVRVRSFTFVSLSSCLESRVFVYVNCFLRFTILFIALSFVRSSRSSPHIRLPTNPYFISLRHNLHCDSRHAIIFQADTETSVFVCILLSLSCSSNSLNHDSSDLILNLNRYRQPIWIDMITDRTARGHAMETHLCFIFIPLFTLASRR